MATVPVGSSIPAEAEDEALWEAEDERFSDWEEEIDARAQSLFDSTAIFPSAAACLAHDRSHYSFDLVNLAQRLNLDSFGCIKLVNYLRIQQCSAEEANALQDPSILDDESLFRPVIQDDALLQLDFDDLLEDQQQQPQPDNATVQAKQIQQLKEAYENLKLAYQKRIEESDGSASTSGSSDDDRREASSRRQGRRLQRNEKKEKQPDFDSHYFNSYSQNEIHETMLSDKIRTESYRDFILHSGLFKDAIVLDVGCGTGVLSLFAAEAGAKHVYAVDASDIALKATANVLENNMQHRITVLKSKVEDVQLPVPSVDIIISEWMGYFCIYESMLDSVLVARDRFLKPGGVIAPSQCTMLFSAISPDCTPARRASFWDQVYGYKMNAMKSEVFEEAQIDLLEPEAVISNTVVLKDIHIMPVQIKDLEAFTAPFTIKILRDGVLAGFSSYFDTFFTRDGRLVSATDYTAPPGEVVFSTCPGPKGETHWKQCSFILEEPRQVSAGEEIKGEIDIFKSPENPREVGTRLRFEHRGEQIKDQWAVR